MRFRKYFIVIFLSFSAIKTSSQKDSLVHCSVQLVGSPLFSGSHRTALAGVLLAVSDKRVNVKIGVESDIPTDYNLEVRYSMGGRYADTSIYSNLTIPFTIGYNFIVRKKWDSYISLDIIDIPIPLNQSNNSHVTHYNYYRHSFLFSRLGLGAEWSCNSKIKLFAEPYIYYVPESSYEIIQYPGNIAPPEFLWGVLFGVSFQFYKYSL